MNRAVVIMVVMLHVGIMRCFMRECGDFSGEHAAPLHCKAMQRQAHQQQNAEKFSHGGRLYQLDIALPSH